MESTNKNWINIGLTVLAIIILLFLIGSYYNHKIKGNTESFYNNNSNLNIHEPKAYIPGPIMDNVSIQSNEIISEKNEVKAQKGLGKNEVFSPVPVEQHSKDEKDPFGLKSNQYPTDCYPKDTLTAAELLPSDPNSKWAQVNPAGQGELGDQNFLEAGFHIGTNTVGQTLRNPNLQLRSEPPNPQLKVSPWMQTTIEPDSNRKPMEIGGF